MGRGVRLGLGFVERAKGENGRRAVKTLHLRRPDLQQHFATAQPRDISLGKEMATVPESVRQQVERGSGYEALGKVYRDPKTGKLVLIGE